MKVFKKSGKIYGPARDCAMCKLMHCWSQTIFLVYVMYHYVMISTERIDPPILINKVGLKGGIIILVEQISSTKNIFYSFGTGFK